ncbi:MAG: hypothetical protein KDD50_07770, partial [Bdellovibrionales bacterium]|nr:hypothetical protein [Bdellovibrionales bacterium]
MIKYITTALVLVLFGLQLNSTTNHQICEGIVPDNDLYIPPFSFFSLDDPTGITEEQFNAVIDKTEAVYKDIIAEMGGDLQFQRNWDDGTVNAFANREGDTWLVAMFGGLARHFTITEDAFMMVVCHELGHHIGGAPKYNGDDWASNEGQA